MWEFFQAVFENGGPYALLSVGEIIVIGAVLFLYYKKDRHADNLQQELVASNRERVADVLEDREKYIELSKELEVTIKTLIAVYRRNGPSDD
jgi:hypothetical protein